MIDSSDALSAGSHSVPVRTCLRFATLALPGLACLLRLPSVLCQTPLHRANLRNASGVL